jgi:hypothetical protein
MLAGSHMRFEWIYTDVQYIQSLLTETEIAAELLTALKGRIRIMSNNYGPRIVTDGLVLCLDAADQNSYAGSGSTWYDLSGNNNHFTLNNSPTYSFEGGGNIIFDGTNDEAELSSWSWPSTCSISFFIYPLSGQPRADLASRIRSEETWQLVVGQIS